MMLTNRGWLFSLITVVWAVGTGWAQPQDRIAGPINEGARTVIRGNVRNLASAADLGRADASLPLSRITLYFSRTPAQELELQGLIRRQHDPASPDYHKWLTPQQYADRFGITETDMARTREWLGSHGFQVVEEPAGRSYIAFSGTAGQVQEAFATEIRRYRVNGEMHVANASDPKLPTAMAAIVLGVRGLDDFRPRPKGIRNAKPRFTSSISGNHFLTPDDFATIYDLKPLYDLGIDGTGQWVGVMGQTDIPLADIANFRSLSGLSANAPVVKNLPNYTAGVSNSDIGEADLDVEWAGAVARKATIVYVNAGTAPNMGAFDSLTYAVNTPITVGNTTQLVPIITISYGACEDPNAPGQLGWPTAQLQGIESTLQQASTQGQTVVGPGGDAGATDCESSTATLASDGLWVDFPASSPFVTGIGGTMFSGGGDPNNTTDVCPNNAPCWSSSNNSLNGSALMYIPEKPWNETSTNPNNSVPANANCTLRTNCMLAGGGGGPSSIFTKTDAPWQTGFGDSARDVPDISLAGAFVHDGYLICASNQSPADCSNGFRDVNQNLDAIGGTSAGAPTFAGMVALLNQMLANQGQANAGFLNPALYSLAAKSSDAFHDITSGDNKMPCAQGTKDCPSGGSIGFSAGAGYDMATGLGSVDGYNLLSELVQVIKGQAPTSPPPPPDFTLTPSGSTTLNVTHGTSSNYSIALAGVNGFNGTVTFSCIVPNTLAGVTCTPPAAMSTAGNATFIITASSTARLMPPGAAPTFLAWNWGGGTLIAGLLLGAGERKKKRALRTTLLAGALLVLALVLLAGCGGSSGGTINPPPPPGPTPESGTVVLQGLSNANVHIVPITVNVN